MPKKSLDWKKILWAGKIFQHLLRAGEPRCLLNKKLSLHKMLLHLKCKGVLLWFYKMLQNRLIFRNSHRSCSIEKGVLKNLVNFTGKHLRVSFFKLQAPTTLLKKRIWHRCFPVNFVKFSRTTFSQNTPGHSFWNLEQLQLAAFDWSTSRYTNADSKFSLCVRVHIRTIPRNFAFLILRILKWKTHEVCIFLKKYANF